MPTVTPFFETLSTDECAELLRRAPVGRIAISIGALPVVLPVNFVVQDRAIVIGTVAGTQLAAATSEAVVAFEAGDFEPDGRSGWSVMVQGLSSEVKDPVELDQVRRAGLESWVLEGRADRVVRIDMQVVTGRRFSK